MKHLRSVFEGNDYDQTLKLFYGETLVFDGVADDLVTSVNGVLQLRLNFFRDEGFLHTLRLSGEYVVLVPIVSDVDSESYLKCSGKIPHAWLLSDLTNLWEQLRYDPAELKLLPAATSDELFLVWLISSQFSSIQTLRLSTMSSLIGRNIIAENVDDLPTTLDIIHQLNEGTASLKTVQYLLNVDESAVTAYIDDVDGSVINWRSLSSDRKNCIIGGNLAIHITTSP